MDTLSRNTKTPIKELGGNKSNEIAAPGTYRACVILDSCVYQIGEDTPDRMVAFGYCQEYSNEMQPVQIFDDKGEIHIIKGKLKMGKDNSFLTNASSYFEKLMKQTYISKPELVSLKRMIKHLKENNTSEVNYNNLFNRITNLANNAKGKNSVEILRTIYVDFTQLHAS